MSGIGVRALRYLVVIYQNCKEEASNLRRSSSLGHGVGLGQLIGREGCRSIMVKVFGFGVAGLRLYRNTGPVRLPKAFHVDRWLVLRRAAAPEQSGNLGFGGPAWGFAFWIDSI